MIRQLLFPGLLDTGTVQGPIAAIRNIFVNLYVARIPEGLVCFDTGWHRSLVQSGFQTLGLDPRDVHAVFLTHEHWDHARGTAFYPNARLFAGEKELATLKTRFWRPSHAMGGLRHGQTVTIGGALVRAVETPGHTAGSMAFLLDEQFLFTGDTVRLCDGRAHPFPSIFNRAPRDMAPSLRTLAEIPNVKMLLTAHTGYTADVAAAFRAGQHPAA